MQQELEEVNAPTRTLGLRGQRRSHLDYRNWPERRRLKSIRETLAETHVERS